jgi:hypothetical protein
MNLQVKTIKGFVIYFAEILTSVGRLMLKNGLIPITSFSFAYSSTTEKQTRKMLFLDELCFKKTKPIILQLNGKQLFFIFQYMEI